MSEPTKAARPKAFFFHYNKPLSQQRGRNMLTVHYGGVCHFAERVSCKVPIESRDRKTQPRCVMAGKARSVEIIDGTAHIS